MADNIIEDIVVPDNPSTVPGEQNFIFVPIATNVQKGVAAFVTENFIVTNGMVAIRTSWLTSFIAAYTGTLSLSSLTASVLNAVTATLQTANITTGTITNGTVTNLATNVITAASGGLITVNSKLKITNDLEVTGNLIAPVITKMFNPDNDITLSSIVINGVAKQHIPSSDTDNRLRIDQHKPVKSASTFYYVDSYTDTDTDDTVRLYVSTSEVGSKQLIYMRVIGSNYIVEFEMYDLEELTVTKVTTKTLKVQKVSGTGGDADIEGNMNVAGTFLLKGAATGNTDYNLKTELDKVEAVQNALPTGADAPSSANKLTTSTQVKEMINRMAAFYIAYTNTGLAFPSFDALDDATVFYSGNPESTSPKWIQRVPTQNDYAYVLVDETHDNQMTEYFWSGGVYPNGSWVFAGIISPYALTNTQLAAINSGITAEGVSQIGLNADAIDDINDCIPEGTDGTNPLINKDYFDEAIGDIDSILQEIDNGGGVNDGNS